MNMNIHPRALVDEKAILGKDVKVGPNTIIGPNVKIGDRTEIGANVVIEGRTEIGTDCKIFTGAIIGTIPQDLKYKGEDTAVFIGNNCMIREYVTINKGTIAMGETRIGNNCLLMSYVHVAHDCVVGNGVILANNATLAGHVEVHDMAIIGGLTPIHQFVKVGELAIVGGASRVSQDVPPYSKSAGSPLKIYGLNVVGLERKNITAEAKKELKDAYKIFFRSNLNTKQAFEEIEKVGFKTAEVVKLIDFIKHSERGIPKE